MNSTLSITLASVCGLSSWSFAEYIMHRFLGHACKGRNHFSREHLAHHSDPNYFAPAWQKAILASFFFATLFLVTRLIFSGNIAVAYSACFALSYGFYEVLHRRIHTHEPVGSYGRMVRKHHLRHHFSDARTCHGVTTRFWDRVFGTHVVGLKVRVPRKLATRWMLSKSGELKAHFADTYELVGRTRSALDS